MSLNKVIINAELLMKPNSNEDVWESEGIQKFSIEMDTDILLYCDNREEVFQKLLWRKSGNSYRYKFVDYMIEFDAPLVLGSEADFVNHMS